MLRPNSSRWGARTATMGIISSKDIERGGFRGRAEISDSWAFQGQGSDRPAYYSTSRGQKGRDSLGNSFSPLYRAESENKEIGKGAVRYQIGECWQFQANGFCNNQQCRFTHCCGGCGGSHPTESCKRKGSSNKGNKSYPSEAKGSTKK